MSSGELVTSSSDTCPLNRLERVSFRLSRHILLPLEFCGEMNPAVLLLNREDYLRLKREEPPHAGDLRNLFRPDVSKMMARTTHYLPFRRPSSEICTRRAFHSTVHLLSVHDTKEETLVSELAEVDRPSTSIFERALSRWKRAEMCIEIASWPLA
jgi:hypothetical protein